MPGKWAHPVRSVPDFIIERHLALFEKVHPDCAKWVRAPLNARKNEQTASRVWKGQRCSEPQAAVSCRDRVEARSSENGNLGI